MRLVHPFFTELNWPRALGEVSLIFVGILAALAVDAWWDYRNERATERAYLHQLSGDLNANAAAIDELLTAHSGAARAATILANAFDAEGPLPSCNTTADLLQSALNWTPLRLRTGTYSALLTTGDIKLIRNEALRAGIIQYAGLVDTVTEGLNLNEVAAWPSAHPFRRRVTYFWRLFEPRQPSDPPPWSKCDFEPFRQDPEIREALFSMHLLHMNRIGMVEELAEANRTVRRELTSEMGPADDAVGEPASQAPPPNQIAPR